MIGSPSRPPTGRYPLVLEFVIAAVIQKFTFEPGDSKTDRRPARPTAELRVNRA